MEWQAGWVEEQTSQASDVLKCLILLTQRRSILLGPATVLSIAVPGRRPFHSARCPRHPPTTLASSMSSRPQSSYFDFDNVRIPTSPKLGSEAQQDSSTTKHTLPRSPSVPNWKALLRFPSKKNLTNTPPALTLEPHGTPVSMYNNSSNTPATTTGIATTPSLTPTSFLSDQRSSYNSSNTQSSGESHIPPGSPGTPRKFGKSKSKNRLYHAPSTDALTTATAASGSRGSPYTQRTTSYNTSLASGSSLFSPKDKPYTAHPSQSSFHTPQTPSSQQRSRIINTTLSPKSVGASATRFLRRVASAPNAKGLFNLGSNKSTTKNGFLAPVDDSLPVNSSLERGGNDSLDTISSGSSRGGGGYGRKAWKRSGGMTPPKTAPLARERLKSAPAPPDRSIAFRRTYSSNSIKVRQVEVGPSSFLKIKMLGKGDVGRVYLVREKKTNKLYAMKGRPFIIPLAS